MVGRIQIILCTYSDYRKEIEMRKFNLMVCCIFLLGCFLGTNAWSQTEKQSQQQTEPRTKLESFQRQSGTVVIKGYSEIGTISALGSIEVKAMEFTDATSRTQQLGIIVQVNEAGRFENTDRSFIDYDEIDALLKGLDYISKVNGEATKLSSFEATYKTKGDFKATVFNSSSGRLEGSVSSGYIRPATVFLSLEQLIELRGYINQAKQKLDSIKIRPTNAK